MSQDAGWQHRQRSLIARQPACTEHLLPLRNTDLKPTCQPQKVTATDGLNHLDWQALRYRFPLILTPRSQPLYFKQDQVR